MKNKTAEAILQELRTDENLVLMTGKYSLSDAAIVKAMTLYAAQFEQKWLNPIDTPPINGEIYTIVYHGIVQHIAYRFVKFEDDGFFECCHDESLTLEVKDVSLYTPLPTTPITKP